MTKFIEWLLSLDNIRWGRDAPLYLKWEVQPPPWVIAVLSIATIALVVMVYRHERTSRRRRAVLAVLRCILIGLVAAVLCGPALVLERNRDEPSYVALLVDTSASMARKDVGEDVPSSRLAAVQSALGGNDSAALRRLLQRNGVELLSFAGQAEVRGFVGSEAQVDVAENILSGLVADGVVTDLANAIDGTLAHAQGKRLAAIVLAGDGRATESGGLKDAVDRARGRQIPIFPIRVGSPIRPTDIEVGPLRAEQTVYLQDQIVIEAKICATGLTGPTPISVRLIDERQNAQVATQPLILTKGDAVPDGTPPGTDATDEHCASVELRTKPSQLGALRYRVEVDPLPHEEITDNNADRVDINVHDARLRVLFVDGYPRYEYRYLKNALLREATVELSVLLLEADEQFVQEGTEPIRRFPETPEELGRYDAVLFGDVDPRSGWLSAAQMNMILDFVGNDGGGFALIAGERFAPQRFLGTPLEKLIPVRIDPEFLGHYESALTVGFRVQLTPEGRASRLFQTPPAGGDVDDAQFESLSELYWVARSLGAKPGASILAHHPVLRTRGGRDEASQPMPLMVLARYGAGRVFFQATDDTWRWRRFRVGATPAGELLHDMYWVQIARMLAPARRIAQDPRFTIRTDRRSYPFGGRVRVEVEVFDSQLLGQVTDALHLVLTDVTGPVSEQGTPPRADDRQAGFVMTRFDAGRRSPESPIFEAALTPARPGRYMIHVEDFPPPPGERAAGASLRVDRPDVETRRPEADHETLQQIAESTGGRVFELDELESGFAEIKDRRAQIPDDIVEPLSDSKLVLLLFVLIISVEWSLRKGFGLL